MTYNAPVTAMARGADHLVAALVAAGVTRIFSLSGNQIMPVYDACIDARIEIIHVRHEAAAVFMADAWAQLTGTLGVAMVTAAPGAANALGPLFTARQSESPVLFLTGDSPRNQDGLGAFQELDQVPMTAPLTKLSLRASSAAAIGEEVTRAIQVAMSGRPGPVHLALPFDVLEEKASVTPQQSYAPVAELSVDASGTASVLAELQVAQKPIIVTTGLCGETRATGLLDRLAAALDAPAIAMESPRGLKDPSLGDIATVFDECDLVISLGKPVNFTLGFGAKGKKWIVIDPETAEIERAQRNLGDRLCITVISEPRAFAERLTQTAVAPSSGRDTWRSRVQTLIAQRSFTKSSTAPDSELITPQQLCEAVDAALDRAGGERLVICDGGEFGQWAQAVIRADRRIINGPSGAIGGGICYGVPARLSAPNASIVAMMGDGTAGFHLPEFETAVRAGTPFVVVIGNDECWNAEHQIQLREYGPDRLIGCDLSGARYDLAVAGLGGHGEYVTDAVDLDAALDRAFAAGKVACVNVRIKGIPAPSGPAH